jgi:hypothetical protein
VHWVKVPAGSQFTKKNPSHCACPQPDHNHQRIANSEFQASKRQKVVKRKKERTGASQQGKRKRKQETRNKKQGTADWPDLPLAIGIGLCSVLLVVG